MEGGRYWLKSCSVAGFVTGSYEASGAYTKDIVISN